MAQLVNPVASKLILTKKLSEINTGIRVLNSYIKLNNKWSPEIRAALLIEKIQLLSAFAIGGIETTINDLITDDIDDNLKLKAQKTIDDAVSTLEQFTEQLQKSIFDATGVSVLTSIDNKLDAIINSPDTTSGAILMEKTKKSFEDKITNHKNLGTYPDQEDE